MNKINASAVQPHYVAIRPNPVLESDEIIKRTEIDREKEAKKQNVGVVVMLGRSCNDWISEGDLVSFYRHAATPVPIPGEPEDILLVHEDHILVKLA